MEIVLQIILLIVGFVILIKGADWLISGSVSTASHFKVSKQLIGLTIVAFGTGAPELAISISSLFSGNTDMLVGNVVGSNIMNILLLVGIGAVIFPINVHKNTIKKELPLLLLISFGLIFLFLDINFTGDTINAITRSDALIFVLFFAIFIYYIVEMTRRNRKEKGKVEKPEHKLGKSIILIILGLAGVVCGSELVVNSASTIATAAGVSDRLIALTIVAFGTSLPELATTITAARRRESELLVGNIIGSNIFNICMVLGLPIVFYGTIALESFEILDIVMLISSAVLLWIFSKSGEKITRAEGATMLLVFAAYYGYIIYAALA